ncbi:MAG TPA: adenylate/guanylate cyclase domain-containing protein [Candidatus Eisenbacteria bacterium]|nr:adenylate/guanylate cyclase domain-containing protein [Candidatus Eisenbacteria bacterium]
MITCPNCGTANVEAARFCMNCGHPLAAVGPSREARKVVTVVFADVTGSTGLGERLDPESLRAIMGRWFEAMREVLERHGGTVEKFIGDAVVAVFGVPTLHEDDALRAVRATADMRIALANLNRALEAERGLEIQMRVGVNTGQVVVGDARAGGSRATGDAVNVAARLQQAAEPGEVLVGDSTWRLVRDAVTTGEPRDIEVKGREEPVTVRRLVDVDQTAEAIHRRVGGPMVGRERELGILRAAFERATVESRCVLVTVLGTAGVGKSRLTHEFLAGIRPGADGGPGATVARGRCLPYGQAISWFPIAELLRSAVGLDDEADPNLVVERLRERVKGLADADTILARLVEPLGIAPEPAPIEELFWAVRRFLEKLATEGPLVVVIDDLQWAESTALDLVEHLADWVHGVPLLILALARPELLDTRSGWGGGKPDATTFLLEPLPSDQTDQLVEALFGGADVPEAARRRIAAAADGNPLFAEQVLEMLLDDGLVRRRPDGSLEVGELDAIAMPPTIQALLAARLDRLSDPERRTIERASVVGKEFGQRDVSELTPAEARPAVGGQLMALVRKELIRPDRRRDDGDEMFRFRHLLIRDAAYDSLPKAERAELHERFADWLELSAGERLAELDEIVGYHLTQARTYRLALGPDDEHTKALALRAGKRLLAAGKRAAARDDYEPAARLLGEAEALLVNDVRTRYGALLALADLLFLRDYAGALRVALQAEAVGEQISEQAALRARTWVLAGRAGEDPSFTLEGFRPQMEAAIETSRAAGDIDGILDGLQGLVIVDIVHAHWADAVSSARLGLQIATEHGLESRRGAFLRWLANALVWGTSDAAESLREIEALLPTETRRSSRASMLGATAVLRGLLDDRPGVEAADAEETAIRRELGDRPRRWKYAFANLGLDDLPKALAESRAEEAELAKLGETGDRSTMVALQAWIHALRGENERALERAADARDLGASDDAATQLLWRVAAGLAQGQLGNLGEADRLTAEALALAAEIDSVSVADAWEARARVLWMLGRRAEMLEAATRARELHAAKGSVNFLRRLDRFLADIGAARFRPAS